MQLERDDAFNQKYRACHAFFPAFFHILGFFQLIARRIPGYLNGRQMSYTSISFSRTVNHGSDVTVLENQASALPGSPDGDIHHGPRQVVGPNHLVGEQHPKRGVDRAQQAVS